MKRLNLRLLAFAIFSFFFLQYAGAQDHLSMVKAFLQEKAAELGLSKRQDTEVILSSSHQSEDIGVTHFYFQQHFEGIPVNRAILNVHVGKDNKVLTYGSTFVASIENRISGTKPALSSWQALEALVQAQGYVLTQPLTLKETKQGSEQETIFEKGNISMEDIPVKLVYQPMESGSVRLAWDILIDEPGGQNYWSIRVDAITGEILEKTNLVIHCNFGDTPHTHRANSGHSHVQQMMAMEVPSAAPVVGGGSYRVFKEPLESPSHGGRTLVTDPADAVASPFGWHDTNGAAGPEFTITRGNNVHAGLDLASPNGIDAGSEPNGGAGLVFDFPLDLSMAPSTYRPAAVTNLFYWNNLVHDFSYKYGFTEASGNFQVNNYGRGGTGNDDVRAEGQDFSGTNNANFATPTDGNRPRMQMFIWNQGASSVTVNPPSPPAVYATGNAGFGPLNFNISGDLELANPLDGCLPLVGFTAGKIAVIDRGSCTFVNKVLAAEAAGAIAVIICNNVPGDPGGMGGAGPVNIPSLMLSQNDCNTIKLLMQSGTVNITMDRILNQYDSDFDNGVIAHEYGHGISNRLTGGPANVNCLNNDEQMGEGWSDFYALMMTLKPGDNGADARGIGTYVSEQPITGNGIRPTPYSTDMSINPSTYNTIQSVSVPHGVGYVWCSMLWDLTWAMIEDHGFSAGFDVAMWLVNDGMKLQPCSPGFVTGRNAILAADMARYGGANQCRIWEVFARRGLGVSAGQGSANSVFDGTEAYDLPDADGDGVSCKDDCDDNDDTVYPGAPELCDSKDNNCNGSVDEAGPLHAPWMNGNIGNANGSAVYKACEDQFTLTAKGFSSNLDLQHSAWRSLCGDGSITARIVSIGNGGWAGIEIRENTTPGSKKVALKTQLTTFVRRILRTVTNAAPQSQQFPAAGHSWLRITRTGNSFVMFVSSNGTNWQQVGSVTLTLPNCVKIGLFAESINVNTTTTAVFGQVTFTGGVVPLARPDNPVTEMAAPNLQVYPNPTSGEVTVNLSAYADRIVRLELYDVQGKVVKMIEVDGKETATQRLDLSAYQNGIYLIRAQSDGVPDATKRVVVNGLK